MDYIREELLRQSAAWAALLLGQPAQEPVAAERRNYHADDAAAEERIGTVMEEIAAWDQRGGLESTRKIYRRTGLQQQELPMREAEWDFREVTALQTGDIRLTDALQSEGSRRRNLPATEQTKVRERVDLTILRPGREETQGARRLSRIYQRDARRYDGGFALY